MPRGAELAHAALLFQNAEERFDDGLAASIGELPVVGLKLSSHPALRWSAGLLAAAQAQVEAARKVRVGHIRIQLSGFHLLQGRDREEPAVGQGLPGRLATALLYRIDHGEQRSVIGSVLGHPLGQDQVVARYGDLGRVAQFEAAAGAKKNVRPGRSARASSGRSW